MSATPTNPLEGSHAPSPFELLWARYRSLILTVTIAVLGAVLLNAGWKYYSQQQSDAKYGAMSASLGLQDIYGDSKRKLESLQERLADADTKRLETELAVAPLELKPYILVSLARKSIVEKQWEVAEKWIDELEKGYPQHSLVRSNPEPIQVRDPIKSDEADTKPQKKPEWKPAKSGSVVSILREQITEERKFDLPTRFRKPEVPGDAPRVKFEVGSYGSFVVALMPETPLHRDAFLELARSAFWKDLAIDEVQRAPASGAFDRPKVVHFGYESTKEDDRTKWDTTEPSKHQVEFEEAGLSHFPGALAGRLEADGKSCVDRLWISVDDNPMQDGSEVVFGYVVEGLEECLARICEAGMSAAEEDRGQGRPTENIRITGVEVLP